MAREKSAGMFNPAITSPRSINWRSSPSLRTACTSETNPAPSRRATSSCDQRPVSWSCTARPTLVTSSVAANAKMNSWISGGANTTMRLRGSRRMLSISLTTCARRRANTSGDPCCAIGQNSRLLRVARLASTKNTTPMAAIASRSGTNTAQVSPARKTVFSEDTK